MEIRGLKNPHIIRREKIQGNKEYHCSICIKNISRSQCYYHQYCANKDDSRHICTICDKKFASKSHLNYHLQSHADKYLCCMKCGQTLINSTVLKKHEKLYCPKRYPKNILKCNICSKTYLTLTSLQRHGPKHIEKKFKCKKCNKEYKRNTSLKEHTKKHFGVKSLSCNICYRFFKDSSALRRHIKLHTDILRYKCPICSTTISRKDNMLRHLRNMHNGVALKNSFDASQSSIIKSWKYTTTNFLDLKENGILNNSISDHFPKTIANSSVIKYVGNVKPILIAGKDISDFQHGQEQVDYDPIAMYRKILTMADNTEIKTNLYNINKKK